MGAVVTRRRFTADEYQCMGKAGIIHDDERVELIDGEIIQMTPIGDRHVGCIISCDIEFNERLRGRAFVSIQNPVRLSPRSEPQPDVVLLRPRPDRYRRGLPRPEDVLLLIEVADRSLRYDRQVKLPRYAEAGIPEVWIVDVRRSRIEVYREPVGRQYRSVTVFERGAVISPLAFPDLALPCDEILP